MRVKLEPDGGVRLKATRTETRQLEGESVHHRSQGHCDAGLQVSVEVVFDGRTVTGEGLEAEFLQPLLGVIE